MVENNQISSNNNLYRHKFGKQGEEIIEALYIQNNYTLVAKNYYFYIKGTKIGEIDLIFEKDSRLYLIEVKRRSLNSKNSQLGNIGSQLVRKKMKNLERTFYSFLRENKQYQNYKAQFDLVTIVNGNVKIIPNAYMFDK